VFREEHEKISDYISILMRKSDAEFFKAMKITKKTFSSLIQQLQKTVRFSDTKEVSRGKRGTLADTALAVTLWYLGNLTSQRDIAERFHIAQGHLSSLVKDVVDCLCSMAIDVICWPDVNEMPEVEAEFKKLADFPGVLGAIDGCHVCIQAPEYCQSDYLDRNHNHSVNLLAVCDSSKRFTYCFAGYPGSVHGQRVFANSALGEQVCAGSQRHFPSSYYHIVGDSAFQLHQHVMVPYKDTGDLTVQELNYNRKLSQTRRVIENAFGFLKGRFRSLKRLECKLSRVPNNIIAYCILHNLTVCDKKEMDLLVNDDDYDTSDLDPTGIHAPKPTQDVAAAKRKRDHLAQLLLQAC